MAELKSVGTGGDGSGWARSAERKGDKVIGRTMLTATELRCAELEKLLGDGVRRWDRRLKHMRKLRQERGRCPLCKRRVGSPGGQECEDGCFVAELEVVVPSVGMDEVSSMLACIDRQQQTAEFKFEIGLMVEHVDYEIKGSVIGLWVDRDTIRWVLVERVKADGELTEDWFREQVLTEIASDE